MPAIFAPAVARFFRVSGRVFDECSILGVEWLLTQAAGLGIATLSKPFDMGELASIVDRARAPHAA
jgi:hypothetical protein